MTVEAWSQMHIGEALELFACRPIRQVGQSQMDHHGRRPGAEPDEPSVERCTARILGEQPAEYDLGVDISDHRPARLEGLASGEAHARRAIARCLDASTARPKRTSPPSASRYP